MRVAQANAAAPHEWRLVLADGGLKDACQVRRRHLAHGRGKGRAHRVHELADAAAVQGGDVVHGREIEEAQALRELVADLFASLLSHVVPLIDREHECAAAIGDETE